MLKNRIIEDEELEKPFDKEQFKRLIRYMKPYRKQVIITLILMMVAAVCGLLGPYFLQVAIDDYIEVADYRGLTIITLLFLATNLINMVCMKQRVYIMSSVGQKSCTGYGKTYLNIFRPCLLPFMIVGLQEKS